MDALRREATKTDLKMHAIAAQLSRAIATGDSLGEQLWREELAKLRAEHGKRLRALERNDERQDKILDEHGRQISAIGNRQAQGGGTVIVNPPATVTAVNGYFPMWQGGTWQ